MWSIQQDNSIFTFRFQKYLSPIWYFYLTPKGDIPYFVDWDQMDETVRALVDFDEGYSSEEVAKVDAAWQAWHRGLIESDPEKALVVEGVQPSLQDEYRFVRKYFHPLWSWYVLGLQLLSGHNPVRELRAFWSQRKAERVNLYDRVFPHDQAWKAFDSPLLREEPLVTVVIPTLNRYPWLKDVLHDLEKQTYTHFEVIVVDQSEPFRKEFYDGFHLDLQLIRQEEKALWLARNTAIEQAKGDLILLFDDDSRVDPDWIASHIKCLDYFNADISSGVSISLVGAKVPAHYAYFRWSDQLDTGNAMVKRKVFERIGLFDRQFEGQRQGDGEFGLRAYLAGFRNISNPYARRLHLKVDSGGLRQMGSWDGFRPKSWLAPRPVPSVLYLCRKYFGDRAARYLLLKGVPPSLISYRYKRNPLVLLLGLPLT
ncbi:MAG: glycosyltransferase, partial [Gammaproteobacteria bacterium]